MKGLFISLVLATGLSFAASSAKPVIHSYICSEETLVDLFPDSILREVLTSHGVASDKINTINHALEDYVAHQDEDEELQTPEAHANSTETHRVDGLSDENLLKAFTTILQANGTSDTAAIAHMYQEIQDKRVELLKKCLITPPPQR